MKTLKINLVVLLVLTINFAHSQETAKAQEKAKMNQVQTEKAAYACPMKCEGEKTYDQPGSCPKCKMDLKKMETKTSSMKMKMDQSKMKQDQMEKAAYACPMHAAVKSDKPGACPKCGMDLKKMEMKTNSMKMKMDQSKMKQDQLEKAAYACPMKCEGEKTYDKPGSCPKCKMDLKKMETNKDSATMNMGQCNMEMGQACACPMHAAAKSDKTCTCPKCGMELKEKKMEMKKDSATMNMGQCNMEMGQACACPMHAAAKSDKTCTCPKCGMELKEKKTEMKKVE
ncbi:MAG: heavy metal-binding domain-containing protein [Lutibacter sp.]|nr:heavy metal-binding domain-containing protein [Lutibacter sp.]